MDIFLENIKELEKYDLINYIKEIDDNEYNSFLIKKIINQIRDTQ